MSAARCFIPRCLQPVAVELAEAHDAPSRFLSVAILELVPWRGTSCGFRAVADLQIQPKHSMKDPHLVLNNEIARIIGPRRRHAACSSRFHEQRRNYRNEGKGEEIGGKIKAGVGKLIGNEQMEAEGRAHELKGKAKQEAAKSAERTKGKVQEAAGAVKNRVGAVLDNGRMEAEGRAKELEGEARQERNRRSRRRQRSELCSPRRRIAPFAEDPGVSTPGRHAGQVAPATGQSAASAGPTLNPRSATSGSCARPLH